MGRSEDGGFVVDVVHVTRIIQGEWREQQALSC